MRRPGGATSLSALPGSRDISIILHVPGREDLAQQPGEAAVDDADALLLDPSDPAPPSRTGPPLLLRLSPMRLDLANRELDAVTSISPAAIWLRDALGLPEVERLGAKLAVREAEHGLPDGAIGIVAAIESAAGVLAVTGLAARPPVRLVALAYDEAALRASLRAKPGSPVLTLARGKTLLAAAAAGLPVLALVADAAEIEAAARDGFAGAVVRDLALLAAARVAFRPSSDG